MTKQTVCRVVIMSAMMFCTIALTTSCQYKVVRPEMGLAVSSRDYQCPPKSDKYSYSITNGTPTIVKALRDSFATCGIDDLLMQINPHRGRKHLNVYILSPAQSTLRHYVGLPGGLISTVTLFLIPYGGDTYHPFEAHWINLDAESDRRIVIIRSEWVESDWIWLPYVLAHDDGGSGEAYNIFPSEEQNRITYEGWRRIFDRLVRKK